MPSALAISVSTRTFSWGRVVKNAAMIFKLTKSQLDSKETWESPTRCKRCQTRPLATVYTTGTCWCQLSQSSRKKNFKNFSASRSLDKTSPQQSSSTKKSRQCCSICLSLKSRSRWMSTSGSWKRQTSSMRCAWLTTKRQTCFWQNQWNLSKLPVPPLKPSDRTFSYQVLMRNFSSSK